MDLWEKLMSQTLRICLLQWDVCKKKPVKEIFKMCWKGKEQGAHWTWKTCRTRNCREV